MIPMIAIENLTKRYDQVVAVNRLSLSIPEGEIFGFIGPNGAGKTTTIRMMGGLLAPTAGWVSIDGLRIDEAPVQVKQRLGFIPTALSVREIEVWIHAFSADIYASARVFQDAQRRCCGVLPYNGQRVIEAIHTA
jgi:ABC-type multidrug transport system ATPase subunit